MRAGGPCRRLVAGQAAAAEEEASAPPYSSERGLRPTAGPLVPAGARKHAGPAAAELSFEHVYDLWSDL